MWWAWQVGVTWAWVGVAILILATAGGIWTKFGMEVPRTPRMVVAYVVGVPSGRGMGVGGRGMGVGGHGNIGPSNCLRIWTKFGLKASNTPQKGYRLCAYMVGVGGRDNVDPGPRWRDLNQIWHAGSPHP